MMNRYLVFDSSTGRIHRTVVCLGDQVEAQAGVNEGLVLSDAGEPGVDYVDPDTFVVTAIPPRPNPWAVFDGRSKTWLELRSLIQVKGAALEEIKTAAKVTDQTDITISGNVLHADFESRASLFQKVQIAQMAVADGQAFSVDWQLADETVVTLNANQVKAIVRAINTREDAIRAKAHTLLAAIKSATTKEEVLAITWAFP